MKKKTKFAVEMCEAYDGKVEKKSMKHSKLIISGLPKTFNVTHAADYVQPMGDDTRQEDVLCDFYFLNVELPIFGPICHLKIECRS